VSSDFLLKRYAIKKKLECLYETYNHRAYVHPDPVEFLYNYALPEDREIVGFIASALAYGRVQQINNSVTRVLLVMGASPLHFLLHTPWGSLRTLLSGFSHRFATGDNLAALLAGAGRLVAEHGSLQAAFLSGYSENDDNVLPALSHFAEAVFAVAPADPGHLLALPVRGSACKRLNLFLRWMVRQDAVDPGGWHPILKSHLIIPLDTHMHRLGLKLGFTKRKQGNMITALEVTEGFKALIPEDPVRYDFILTRLGVWGEINQSFL
jgi:uncharacterized protein (TIGR02757 family)